MRLSIPVALAVILLLTTVILPPASADNAKILPADHPFLHYLADVTVERGRENRALLIVPVSSTSAQPGSTPRPMTTAEALAGKHMSVGEPENKEGRLKAEVFNWSTKPILMMAGEVLEGGYRDRFLGRDVLLSPGKKVLAPVFPADARKRKRADRKTSFTPLDILAPAYPRYMIIFTSLSAPVMTYVANGYALTGDQHDRKAFPPLLRSAKLATRLKEYRDMFAKVPDEAEKRAVGAAIWVGDRFYGVDLFGSNEEFRAHWPKLLHGLAFQAALYEVANGLVKHPFPAGRDPDRHKIELKALLKKPFAARVYFRDAVDLGKEIRLTRDSLSGRVLLLEDRVVHALLMPDLRSSTTDSSAPRTGPTPEMTYEELIRKAGRTRLTEYERRLLERMRNRRRALGTGRTPRQPDTPIVPLPPKNDD